MACCDEPLAPLRQDQVGAGQTGDIEQAIQAESMVGRALMLTGWLAG